MAKIRHKITKHTTQEVTLDQNNAFKAQKHGNTETFQLRFNDKTDYPLNEIYSINKKIQSQKAIICKNISNPSSSENCLEVSTSFSEDFYFEFEINTNTSIWFTNNDIQYSLGNFELEVHYTQSGTTQFINLYYNENAVPGPISDSWLTGEFGPELSNEDLQNGVKFFTDQLSSSVSHVILKIKGAGAVSLTKITAKKYSDNSVLKNYVNPYKEMSGITSNSVRKVGRNINNKSSLPNYYKEVLTGITNRNITYFDTESFVFSDNSNINIVEQIPSDSKFDGYINNIVSTPNTSPGFQSQGSFKSYHLDNIIDRKLELSSIKPYNDEYSYAFQNSDFFASSSNPYNSLDNFTGLDDAVAIEITLDSENGAILSRVIDTTSTGYRDKNFIDEYQNELVFENNEAYPPGDGAPKYTTGYKTEHWGLKNRPMVYYDFSNKRWEYIVSGSNTLITSNDRTNDEVIGFAPGSKYRTYFEKDSANPNNAYQNLLVGNPTRTFGFPADTRYSGLDKNLFSLKNILEKPFALEKVSYEFNFSSRGYKENTNLNSLKGSSMQQNITFFILNQFNNKESNITDINSVISVKNVPNTLVDESILPFDLKTTQNNDIVRRYSTTGVPYKNSSYTLESADDPETTVLHESTIDKRSYREVITFNNIFLHSVSHDIKDTNNEYYSLYTSLDNVIKDSSFSLDPSDIYFTSNQSQENLFSQENVIGSSINLHNYKVKVRDFIKTPLVTKNSNVIELDRQSYSTNVYIDNELGDKDLNGTLSIRTADIKTSAQSNKQVSLVVRNDGNRFTRQGGVVNNQIDDNTIAYNEYNLNNKKNIYMLKPDDNLIFGVELNKTDTNNHTDSLFDEGERQMFYIHPGEFKVILYGRYLQNNKLVNDNHNTQLNSKSINSSIIGDTFPQDQFIEPINIKEDTYVDRIYTGDISLESTREKSGLLSSNTLGVYTGCISLSTNKVYYDSMVPNINDILNSDDNFYITSPSLLTSREMLFNKINDIEFPQALNYFSKNLSINSAEGLLHNVYFGPIEDNFSSFMPKIANENVNNSSTFKEDKTIDIYSFEDSKLTVSSQMSVGIVDIISHNEDADFDIHKNPVGTYKAVVFSGGDDYHIQFNTQKYPNNVAAPDPEKLQQRHIKISSITTPEFKHNTKLTLNITFKTLNAGIIVGSEDESAKVIAELSGLEGFDHNPLVPASMEFRNQFNISLLGKTSGRVYNTTLCYLEVDTTDSSSAPIWTTNYGSAEFIDLPQEEYDIYLFQPHKGGATKDCFALSDLKIIANISYETAKFPIQEYLPFDNLYENLTREIFNESTSNIEYYQNKRPQTLVSHFNDDLSEVVFGDIFVQKHGLLNVKPKESKVYFRDNHYGYYSDLIYTTPSGKMYNKENNLLNDYLVRINKYNNDFTLADISDNYRYGRSFKPFME